VAVMVPADAVAQSPKKLSKRRGKCLLEIHSVFAPSARILRQGFIGFVTFIFAFIFTII